MQIEVAFLGHVVSRAGLACDPDKLSAVRAWHLPDSVKQVRQFVGFVGYYGRFIHNFSGLSEPLVALTRKGTVFAWTVERQAALDALKSCLLRAPILGFPTESDRFLLDTDASLFAEMLATVTMCTHVRSYLCGAQFTLRSDHRSLRWLQKFCNSDGMLARWYMLL